MDSFASPHGPTGPDDAAHELSVPAILTEITRLLGGLGIFTEGERIDPHVPLLDGGLALDSIAVLELVALIEKRYQISFPVEDLNTESFASLAAVARHVHTLIAQRAGAKS
jgi:acyl carrier protein